MPVDEPVSSPTPIVPVATEEPTVKSASPTATSSGTWSLVSTSKGELLEFKQNKQTTKVGSWVTAALINESKILQHNWVLVQPGTKDLVAADGLPFESNGYIKDGDDRVIASIGMVNPGETGETSFVAPAAGIYQFVCTFPAHNFTMWGTLEVSP